MNSCYFQIAAPFVLTVPVAYLAHPVGHLFLQYHALFALERREWVVLRALLKAAVGLAQQQARENKAAARAAAAAAKGGPPTSPPLLSPAPAFSASTAPVIVFRWRPECLQVSFYLLSFSASLP